MAVFIQIRTLARLLEQINIFINLSFHRRHYHIFSTLGLGARSSVAAFWPQLDPGSGHLGGSQRDEGVGSVNSDLTEVALTKTKHIGSKFEFRTD